MRSIYLEVAIEMRQTGCLRRCNDSLHSRQLKHITKHQSDQALITFQPGIRRTRDKFKWLVHVRLTMSQEDCSCYAIDIVRLFYLQQRFFAKFGLN
jgi:hypothetical protein